MSNLFLTISAETEDTEKLILKIDAATKNADILDDAVSFLLNRIRSRFLKETDPDGVLWIPSKAAIKRRKTRGTGTLFDTGRLFRSIQGSGSGDNQRLLGTDVPYAPKLQYGTPKIVPRIFIGIGGDDAQLASDFMMRKIKDRIER